MASEKKMQYDAKFNRENYDQILVRVPKGEKDRLRQRAEAEGKSLNAWIAERIRDTI